LPLVLLEALSFLRPVVFSDIPENLEVAEGLGIPFRCGSVDDLAAKLDYALSDTSDLGSLQQATRNRLAHEYNWDRVTDRYLQIYQDVTVA
jgi:glycosyltransferase involved in cell wall biosynthesis